MLGSLPCVMQHCRFEPPVEGIYPLELTWVETPFPKTSFRWDCKPRSSLCTHAFHRTDWKDPNIHVLDGWMPATKNTPSMHHLQRWNVTTSMVALEYSHIYCKNLREIIVNPRYSWERRRSRRRIPVKLFQWLENWHSSGCPDRGLVLKGQGFDWLARCLYTVIGFYGYLGFWGTFFSLLDVSAWLFVHLLCLACVLYFCICTCSAQLSMFHMERRSRSRLVIIIIIIIIIIITGSVSKLDL